MTTYRDGSVRLAGDPRDTTSTWTLMPPAPGVCSQCAVDHEPDEPHNPQSLYYQYAFYAEHHRWPTWDDALAHCDDETHDVCRVVLARHGVTVQRRHRATPGPVMTKHDLPERPRRPPKKDRHLAKVPDLWIAQWLATDDLSAVDRGRLTALRATRRESRPDAPVGLLVGAEGLTGRQLQRVIVELNNAKPTEIHHPGNLPPRMHGACKRLGVPVVQHRDVRNAESGMRQVVRLCNLVIAAPREMSERATGSPVWNMVNHAKHRSVPVTIVLPDGSIVGQTKG